MALAFNCAKSISDIVVFRSRSLRLLSSRRAPLRQIRFDLSLHGLVDAIEPEQRYRGDERNGSIDAYSGLNAAYRIGRLGGEPCVIVVIRENTGDQGSSYGQAGFQTQQHGGEHDCRRTAIIPPLGVVGDVRDHCPQQGDRYAIEEPVQRLRYEAQGYCVLGKIIEAENKNGRYEQCGREGIALAESIGQWLGESNPDDHHDDAAAIEQAESRGGRVIRPFECRQSDGMQGGIESADEMVEPDVVQEPGKRRLAQVVLEKE